MVKVCLKNRTLFEDRVQDAVGNMTKLLWTRLSKKRKIKLDFIISGLYRKQFSGHQSSSKGR